MHDTTNAPLNDLNTRKLTHVAVGIVHNHLGQVLYAQRPAGKPYAGWWEFPGGKLEEGETLAAALSRELKEELGLTIHDCHAWLTQAFVYPHAHVSLQFCHVRQFSGEPQALEGQAFCWGQVGSPPLPFLPAALPVLKMLQLPQRLLWSGATGVAFEVWQHALIQLDAGLIILHEPELSELQAAGVFKACLNWRQHAPAARKLLVSSVHPQSWWGLADGVHYTEHSLPLHKTRPSCDWVGASISSADTLHAAKTLGCNFVTVGPVMDKQASRLNPAMGWAALAELLSHTQLAAYACGGVSEQDLPFAFAAGAAGLITKLDA